MDEHARRYNRITIAVALLTLVLTPIIAGGVVWYQLRKGHDYWEAQRQIIRQEKRIDLKIGVLEDMADTLWRLTGERIAIHAHMLHAAVQGLIAEEEAKPNLEFFHLSADKLFESLETYTQVTGDLARQQQLVRLLYGEPVSHKAEELWRQFAKSMTLPVTDYAHFRTEYKRLATEIGTSKALSALMAKYSEQFRDPRLMEMQRSLLAEMTKEIAQDLEIMDSASSAPDESPPAATSQPGK